jgi:opacity protein-like surface antigen
MKIKVLASVIAVASAAAALPAAAQEVVPSFYGNLGYTFIDGGDAANFGAATARLGARVHNNLAIEGEAAIGVDGDSGLVAGAPVSTKLKHSFNGYVVGLLPVTPQLDLFVRGGYGTTKVRARAAGVSVSDSEDSWNYGGGVQYLFDARNGVRLEYTAYDFGDATSDAWGVSYVRKF